MGRHASIEPSIGPWARCSLRFEKHCRRWWQRDRKGRDRDELAAGRGSLVRARDRYPFRASAAADLCGHAALGIAACLFVVQLANLSGTLETTRSFFGVYRVRLVEDGALTVLQHGTTIHGFESTRPGDEGVPLGYYSGVILFHVSNRYLDLVPVITALAADAGESARHLHYRLAGLNKVEDAETEVIAVSQPGGDLGFSRPISVGSRR